MADERKPALKLNDGEQAEREKLKRIRDGLRDMCKELTSTDLPDDIREALQRLGTRH